MAITARLGIDRTHYRHQSTKEAVEGKEITILADKTIPFSALKKVMSTCTHSGYGRISSPSSDKYRLVLDAVNTSIYKKKTEPLNARIRGGSGNFRRSTAMVSCALQRQSSNVFRRPAAVRCLADVCTASIRWKCGRPTPSGTASPREFSPSVTRHRESLQERTSPFLRKRYRGAHDSLLAQAGRVHDELDSLHEEVRQAVIHEGSIKQEGFSVVPYRQTIIAWAGEDESERRFR